MPVRALALGAAMLPAAWPALRLYRGLGTQLEVVLFATGYLAVWVLVAGLAMLVMAPAGPLLAVAGLYQLGPVQAASLRRCRAPLGLLMRRSGLGAGVEYAIACAGCCAGLMLALVALDTMMSVFWMAGLVALVLAEKLLRHGVLVSRVAGLAILALAIVTVL
jgi:predicted metal-binding membrane protein